MSESNDYGRESLLMGSSTSSDGCLTEYSLYAYTPNHALPAVFAGIVGVSLIIHCYQNLYA